MLDRDVDPMSQQIPSINDLQTRAELRSPRLAPLYPRASAIVDAVRVRSIFLSDTHLGTAACQAGLLHSFLRSYTADTIYLVGDIIDGWQLQSRWYWPKEHAAVVNEILLKARRGARIVYVPGNHDELLRAVVGSTFERIEIREHAIHDGVDGRRYLVIHGDQFDRLAQRVRWLALFGDRAYQTLHAFNAHLNKARKFAALSYWSISAWTKLNVKRIAGRMDTYEERLLAEARRHNAQGVICGHVHHAMVRDDLDVRYINTGDWVESCTGVVEHENGRFELVRWTGVPGEGPAKADGWQTSVGHGELQVPEIDISDAGLMARLHR